MVVVNLYNFLLYSITQVAIAKFISKTYKGEALKKIVLGKKYVNSSLLTKCLKIILDLTKADNKLKSNIDADNRAWKKMKRSWLNINVRLFINF